MIGADIVVNKPKDAIDSLQDLVDNKHIIPSVAHGTAFQIYFEVYLKLHINVRKKLISKLFQKCQLPDAKLLWKRILQHKEKSLYKYKNVFKLPYIKWIANKKISYIANSLAISSIITDYCNESPSDRFHKSAQSIFSTSIALAFKNNFDTQFVNKINKK
jgi:hypothetical protein